MFVFSRKTLVYFIPKGSFIPLPESLPQPFLWLLNDRFLLYHAEVDWQKVGIVWRWRITEHVMQLSLEGRLEDKILALSRDENCLL